MDFTLYKNEMPCPVKPSRPAYPGRNADGATHRQYADLLDAYNLEMDTTYRMAVADYNKEQSRLDELFKQDSLRESGLSDHPKKDKIYSRAWEDGHADGYYAVFYRLQDLAELFLD